MFDLVRPIDHGAMFLGTDGAFSGQGFAEHKDAGGAAPNAIDGRNALVFRTRAVGVCGFP